MGKSMGGRARSGYARNVDVEKLRLDERRPFRDSPLRPVSKDGEVSDLLIRCVIPALLDEAVIRSSRRRRRHG